jgi:hypothetical protein
MLVSNLMTHFALQEVLGRAGATLASINNFFKALTERRTKCFCKRDAKLKSTAQSVTSIIIIFANNQDNSKKNVALAQANNRTIKQTTHSDN